MILDKGIWCLMLVSNDLPTNSTVQHTTCTKVDGSTAWVTGISCAQPLGPWEQSEALRTVVVGVGHIEVGHPHPPPCTTTAAPLHFTVAFNCISRAIQDPVVAG